MDFTITYKELEKALDALKLVRSNGFTNSTAVLRLIKAGAGLDECKAAYVDVVLKAHPRDPSLDWGRAAGLDLNAIACVGGRFVER